MPWGGPKRLPEFLTVLELAQILRVGRNQAYQAVARGDLPALRIGRSLRIPRSALDPRFDESEEP